jgi:hypothetical protein
MNDIREAIMRKGDRWYWLENPTCPVKDVEP